MNSSIFVHSGHDNSTQIRKADGHAELRSGLTYFFVRIIVN